MSKDFCQKCGVWYTKKTPRQKYHTPKCRQRDAQSRRHYFPNYGPLTSAAHQTRRLYAAVREFKSIGSSTHSERRNRNHGLNERVQTRD